MNNETTSSRSIAAALIGQERHNVMTRRVVVFRAEVRHFACRQHPKMLNDWIYWWPAEGEGGAFLVKRCSECTQPTPQREDTTT